MTRNVKIREEDKEALVDLVREEIQAHKEGKLTRLSTNVELAEVMQCCRQYVTFCLQALNNDLRTYRLHNINSYLVKKLNEDTEIQERRIEKCKKGMIRLNADPEFREANRERCRKNIIRLNKNPTFKEAGRERSKEIMKRLHEDPEFERKRKYMLQKAYENPDAQARQREVGRRVMTRLHEDPEFRERSRVRSSERMIKLLARPGFKEKLRTIGVNTFQLLRKNSYNIEGRFYASSQQEGATALLLEKYIVGYQIKEGENFQVRNKGIKNGGLDFLVNGEFLEWHPPILAVEGDRKKPRRGDVPKEESPSYFKVLKNLSEDEQREFKEDYKKVLITNYRNSRQVAIDNSEYSGKDVSLVTNVGELYNFISKYSANLPSLDEFKTEFNQKVKYVKGFKVEKAKEKSIAAS